MQSPLFCYGSLIQSDVKNWLGMTDHRPQSLTFKNFKVMGFLLSFAQQQHLFHFGLVCMVLQANNWSSSKISPKLLRKSPEVAKSVTLACQWPVSGGCDIDKASTDPHTTSLLNYKATGRWTASNYNTPNLWRITHWSISMWVLHTLGHPMLFFLSSSLVNLSNVSPCKEESEVLDR